jgi:hypothetical protein
MLWQGSLHNSARGQTGDRAPTGVADEEVRAGEDGAPLVRARGDSAAQQRASQLDTDGCATNVRDGSNEDLLVHIQALRRYAAALVGHHADADDLVQETLMRARIEEARAVIVATNNDAEDALAVLTARHLNPDVTIVAAATNRENVGKLRRAGADTVISPATIGGHLLVESAFGRDDTEAVARQLVERSDNRS